MNRRLQDPLGTVSLLSAYWRGYDVDGPDEAEVVLTTVIKRALEIDPPVECHVCDPDNGTAHAATCWFGLLLGLDSEELDQFLNVLTAALAEAHAVAQGLEVHKTALTVRGARLASSGVLPEDPVSIPRGSELNLPAPRLNDVFLDAQRRVAQHRDLLTQLREQTGLIYSTDRHQFVKDPSWEEPNVALAAWREAEMEGGPAWARLGATIAHRLRDVTPQARDAAACWLRDKVKFDLTALVVLFDLVDRGAVFKSYGSEAVLLVEKHEDPRYREVAAAWWAKQVPS